MKRSREVLESEDTNFPNKKKRKLNNETVLQHNNDESKNASNTNNSTRESTQNGNDESKQNVSNYEDVAFYLTKSPLISNNNEFNEYGLCLDEIITTSSTLIEKCIIFSYVIDPEWIFESCPILKNKQKIENVYILHGDSLDEHYNLCNYQCIYDHLRIFKVKMNFSFGTHHTKMIILIYKNEGIRIVITSANMIQRDWCYKTNGIYLQDFPLKTDTNTTSEFGNTLYSYCNTLYGLSNRVIMDFTFLNNYDFSSAKVLLIPSVPGHHKKDNICSFGHKRLQYLLSKHKMATNQNNLILNCSSIGSLDEEWLMNEFFRGSFYGEKDNNFQLIWPTVDDVRNSIEGYTAGGSLCFSQKNCKPFLYKYLRKWNGIVSKRQRLMPHIKTYSVIDEKDKTLMFFVLSSANLSSAAWGKMQKNDSQLFIRSFEMGCLFIPHIYNNYIKHKHKGFNLTDLRFKNIKRNLKLDTVNNDAEDVEFEILYQANKINDDSQKNNNKTKVIFPIPMEVMNTQKYGKEDKPWVWDLQYNVPDLYGLRWPPY